jgi:hypothetical protein
MISARLNARRKSEEQNIFKNGICTDKTALHRLINQVVVHNQFIQHTAGNFPGNVTSSPLSRYL